MPDEPDAGEDDNSTKRDGDDSDLHDDQKANTNPQPDKSSSQFLKEATDRSGGTAE
jgi:hypothetical protein